MAVCTSISLNGKSRLGTAARAVWLLVPPLILFTALWAGQLWWNQNGSFGSVVSRLVPWQSTIVGLASTPSSTDGVQQDCLAALDEDDQSEGRKSGGTKAIPFNQDLVFEPAGS